MILMQKNQSQVNFSQFDIDFDFCSMRGFEAIETQFEPESINLFKKVVSFAFIWYYLLCWFTYWRVCNVKIV